MHWYVLAAAVLAVALVRLGALSVWVLVLSLALKCVFVLLGIVALGVGLRFLWRRPGNTACCKSPTESALSQNVSE